MEATNERRTEDIIRQFYNKEKNLIIEEQYKIKNASKNNTKNYGYPDFFIRHKHYPETCMVIECKADINNHKIAEKEVLHYASYIKNDYDNIILIAASGNEEYFKCTISLNNKEKTAEKIYNKLIPFRELLNEINKDEDVEIKTEEELIKYAIELYNDLKIKVSLMDKEKPLFVSAIMMALKDETFDYDIKEKADLKLSLNDRMKKSKLMTAFKTAIKNVLMDESDILRKKRDVILNTFSFIPNKTQFYEIEKNGHTKFYNIIKDMNDHLFNKSHQYSDLDLVGKFYGEFVKYTGRDGKELGIVLTPSHIADLMCDLAELNVNSVVYDPCTGTGRFLITAMSKMINMADDDKEKIENIRKNQIIGVEMQSTLYTMGAANMIFKGDGKANLYNESCFNLKNIISKYEPTGSILNPPYSQLNKEMEFILHACHMTQPGGKVVAIVPKSVVVDIGKENTKFKGMILNKHTLEAIISMPSDLFYPSASTDTVIIVIKAKIPNSDTNKTYFYNFFDDGFKIIIQKGRINYNYNEVKQLLFDNLDQKKIIPGCSAYEHVIKTDEWILEAYAKTDYSILKPEMFMKDKIQEKINEFKQNPI